MHAPSVGEGLQAKPVLDLMRERHPSLQLAYTWFSPSAREFAAGFPVGFQDALPFDSTPSLRRALAPPSPPPLLFSPPSVLAPPPPLAAPPRPPLPPPLTPPPPH